MVGLNGQRMPLGDLESEGEGFGDLALDQDGWEKGSWRQIKVRMQRARSESRLP